MKLTVLSCVLLLSGLCSAQQEGPRPARWSDSRILALALTMAEDQDFDAAMAHGKAAGMSATTLSLNWDDLEPSPGQYQDLWLDIAELYYPAQEVSVSLMIGPIDTNVIRLPSDLMGRPFDDPLVISRFCNLLDHVFTRIPTLPLTNLSIGNEVDAFLGQDAAQWQQYRNFFAAVKTHAHQARPDLLIGVKVTFDGMVTGAPTDIEALHQLTDLVLLTYYPLTDFQVRPPTTVHQDFQQMVALNPGRKLFLLEAGYPSGALVGSSLAKQAEFIRELFKAWDRHATAIPLLTLTWLTDLSAEEVSALGQYYGLNDLRFLDFLATLGLRTYPGAGADKPAYRVLKKESRRRSFP